MTNFIKTIAAMGVTLSFGTAAFSQAMTGDGTNVDIIGMDCGDFLEADTALQMDITRQLNIVAIGDVDVAADVALDVATLDEDVLKLAGLCDNNQGMMLSDLQMWSYTDLMNRR